MTDTYTWPTREEWEADERHRAEHTIKDGINGWDYGGDHPTFTIEEQDEVDALAPEAIKTVRRACSRIERDLRRAHPEAGKLARGPQEADLEERKARGACRHNYPTTDDINRWYDAVDALTGPARDTYNDLLRLRDVRKGLRDAFDNPWTQFGYEADWPRRHDRPTSPELDRLRALNDQALDRFHTKYREMGRRILADLDSGVAWQHELERRVHVEEYFARGPVVHVIRPNQDPTTRRDNERR